MRGGTGSGARQGAPSRGGPRWGSRTAWGGRPSGSFPLCCTRALPFVLCGGWAVPIKALQRAVAGRGGRGAGRLWGWAWVRLEGFRLAGPNVARFDRIQGNLPALGPCPRAWSEEGGPGGGVGAEEGAVASHLGRSSWLDGREWGSRSEVYSGTLPLVGGVHGCRVLRVVRSGVRGGALGGREAARKV